MKKVKIMAPDKKGEYELEFIAIHYCITDSQMFEELYIISSNRYTLEVK